MPVVIPSSLLTQFYTMQPTFVSSHVSGLTSAMGQEKREPGYVHVPRRILVERLLRERDGATPLEHRAFVFSGTVQVIQTSLVTEEGKPRNAGFFTRDWEPLGWRLINPLDGRTIRRPERLNELIAISERLGAGFSHVRVDFYEHDSEITVGEMTLYSIWDAPVPSRQRRLRTRPTLADTLACSHRALGCGVAQARNPATKRSG